MPIPALGTYALSTINPKRRGQSFKGALGGAIAGGSTFGLPGAIIGGIGGLLGGAFSKSPEEEREERKQQLLETIRRLRTETLTRGSGEISRETASQAAQSRQAAAARATALGRQSEAESFILPGEQQIYGQGTGAIRRFETDVTDRFNQAELSAEEGFADRPIEPTISDYLMEFGGQAANYASAQKSFEAKQAFNNRYLDWLKDTYSGSSQRNVNDFLGSSYGAIDLPTIYGRNPAVTVPTSISRPLPFRSR